MSLQFNWKKTALTTMAAMSLLVTAACGSDEASSGESDEQAYPTEVKIGTASQGGTYFIYGGALGQLLEREYDIKSTVEVTGGPVHNMQLVQARDQDIGFVTLGPAYEGYTGTGWAEGNEHKDVRVVFPMYTTPIHWWAVSSSGIESIEDIKGQRVGVGPSGGTSGTYLPLIHEALELDTNNVQAGASDMASQQMDGQLDIIGFAAGIPISAVTEVEAQRDINIFGIEGEMRDQVIEAYPYFFEYTIPADTYESTDEDVETIAMFNFGIVHKNMDADFVYDLVKSYHKNQDFLTQTHKAAEEAVEEAILRNESLPLHPGAIRYYEEIGIDLPADVYPEEWE
ncbi:TAXI family TRAP transporter solute-binding subunit [Caldalkalibacillus salinus]|uniref:TAXI family TRAP transporter solute-binding subunit n=1 Tax=Caldalkalibacillus salinus TaxID=2803787 RepID=UPI0019219407|nr:TAXI family TRAP transporter solute-binding subunit [Caldalkalibacillus salinus]